MEQNSPNQRLTTLDGLRGVAIILVFLTHINTLPFLQSLNPNLAFLFSFLTRSGRTAVSIFFILCGFLMAYLYPEVPKISSFIQKRYTRIFPPFITMVGVMTLFRMYTSLEWFFRISIIIAAALFTHIMWVYGIKRIGSQILSKSIFYVFVGVQVMTGLLYVFYIMKHPPVYFYQIMSPVVRESIITLVNATLTLPFGNYVPMLDGVYWSLPDEVFFYILYPILCIPLVKVLSIQKKAFKILFIILLMPFFAGMNQISQKIVGLSMMDIPFTYYFVAGIVLAYFYRKNPSPFQYFINTIETHLFKYTSIVLFILTLFLIDLATTWTSGWINAWIRLLVTIPLTVVLALALNEKSSLSRFLKHKLLIFLGTISYSLYLSHTAIVDTAKLIYTPQSGIANVIFILITFIVACTIAYIIHYLLEKPYFMKNKEPKKEVKPISQKIQIKIHPFYPVFIVYFLGLFIAYQSSFNLFSIEHLHSSDVITFPHITENQKYISMRQSPHIKFSLLAQEDNFGVETMNLKYEGTVQNHPLLDNKAPKELEFRIKEAGSSSWYSTSRYKINEIGKSENHPFGFPLIANSKGKKYESEIELIEPNEQQYLKIDMSDTTVKSIYQVDKKDLLKNPQQLLAFIINRIRNVILNKQAQIVFLLAVPSLMLAIYGVFKKK